MTFNLILTAIDVNGNNAIQTLTVKLADSFMVGIDPTAKNALDILILKLSETTGIAVEG